MTLIHFEGSETLVESGCRRPAEENVRKLSLEHVTVWHAALNAYDDRYHRAVQRTLLLDHRHGCYLVRGEPGRGEFGIIRHIDDIEGDNVGHKPATGSEANIGVWNHRALAASLTVYRRFAYPT